MKKMKMGFNPKQIGLKYCKATDSYDLIEKNKIVVLFCKDPVEKGKWKIYKRKHFEDPPPVDLFVYEGKINNKNFATQLLKNIL